MTVLFGRTQQAIDTPFEPLRNPGFGGIPSELESTNVQDAIEEAKSDALNNDRFILLCSYNGNANAGRFMEFFPGIDSSIAPILYPATSRVVDIVAATTSGSATCSFQFVNIADNSVLYTFSFTAQKRVVLDGTPSVPLFIIPANTQLALRVSTGSINRPHIYFYSSAAT